MLAGVQRSEVSAWRDDSEQMLSHRIHVDFVRLLQSSHVDTYNMASVHHYVPRFLLRNFCFGERSRLWAYDKHTGKSFQTNVQNIAGERNFYQIRIGDDVVSLEGELSELESEAAVLIGRIILERNLGWLSEENRALLARFVVVQMNRGPHTRERFISLDQGLRKMLSERFGLGTEGHPPMTTEGAKQAALTALADSDKYAEHILNKTWLLFETSAETPFYTSDNPVTLQNQDKSRGPMRGNLGLAVRGIEIYLPISSTLTLAFYCRSHEIMIREKVDRIRTRIVTDSGFLLDFGPLLDWMRAFRKGTPLGSKPDNVLNHNSLQVMQAERFVFCSRRDFALVEGMINEEPRFGVGPRLTFD